VFPKASKITINHVNRPAGAVPAFNWMKNPVRFEGAATPLTKTPPTASRPFGSNRKSCRLAVVPASPGVPRETSGNKEGVLEAVRHARILSEGEPPFEVAQIVRLRTFVSYREVRSARIGRSEMLTD